MITRTINNPRKPNGDFGDIKCGYCDSYVSAYIELISFNSNKMQDSSLIILCKSCLLDWVDQINETTLQDAIDKGRLRGLK